MPNRLIRMSGRNPGETHRSATPLELLFDLAFVVAFGQAADQLAHAIAEDHLAVGLGGFAFAMFAICWAWINFSWFASAFDTDDWFYRITTFVQMIGVVVLALGIPAAFRSLLEGDHLDNGVIVAGYVVMRIAMVAQWLRVARQDPAHRRTALTYVTYILIAQVGWVVLALLPVSVGTFVMFAFVLYAIELGGPVVAERKVGGTPWHPHHIAERYGLLAIIALGEAVFGTVASVAALVEDQGWSLEAALVVFAGVGITFGLWWTYFIMPSGVVLARHRSRGFVWGYGHILIYAAIAATGAGLHVVAFVIEEAIGHYENRRPRVQKLVSAWNQGPGVAAAPVGDVNDPLLVASEEPRRRTRTPLTEKEVDAMRTARAQGASVVGLARQFDVHRGTVWAKTRAAAR